jgi:hypothetical protein
MFLHIQLTDIIFLEEWHCTGRNILGERRLVHMNKYNHKFWRCAELSIENVAIGVQILREVDVDLLC